MPKSEDLPKAKYREALLPLMFDLIYAPSILAAHRQIVTLFKTAFRIATEEIGPSAEFEDLRWELRNAAFPASLAVVEAVNQTDAARPLREQICYVLEAYIRSRIDHSRPPIAEPDESIESLMLALDAEVDRIVYARLATWKPSGPRTREEISEGRRKRELRFISNCAASGIEVTSARIQRSAGIDRSTTYFAWRSARRHKDGSAISRAIEDVLAGRTPLI